MNGTKALRLRDCCADTGHAMLRLDYSGHGESGGDFANGTISQWAADAELLVRHMVPEAPLIFVGSSMGGWIALILALRFGVAAQAILLIAPAPDFTQALIEPSLTAEQRAALDRDGLLVPPSEYGPPLPITKKLLDDGRHHLLLNGRIAITCPVRILHGMMDADVPWQHSLRLVDCLESEDVQVTFVKDGDHRLSRPLDLARLGIALIELFSENRP
jgi:pimeloyl-ACP methyl ester carboxylesterase